VVVVVVVVVVGLMISIGAALFGSHGSISLELVSHSLTVHILVYLWCKRIR